MGALRESLERRKLLAKRPSSEKGRPESVLLKWCDEGALVGGLSVALGVLPDEMFGALCALMGGGAKELKVLDVRDKPHAELVVDFRGTTERWEVSDARGLVHNLNDLLRDDRQALFVAVLGEWNDALQLWALEKETARQLLRERGFEPQNAAQLRDLLGE